MLMVRRRVSRSLSSQYSAWRAVSGGLAATKTWMAGTSPAMTVGWRDRVHKITLGLGPGLRRGDESELRGA